MCFSQGSSPHVCLPCGPFGAAVCCGRFVCYASLKCPEDRSERAPLQREADGGGEENGSGARGRDEDKQTQQSESVRVTNTKKKKVQSIIDGGAGGNKGADSLAFTEGLF